MRKKLKEIVLIAQEKSLFNLNCIFNFKKERHKNKERKKEKRRKKETYPLLTKLFYFSFLF